MALTEFGKLIRKARIDIGSTLLSMAKELGTTPAYLSGLETGSKKISDKWVNKINDYFESKNIKLEGLAELAHVSNETIPVKNLPEHQKMLIAGFAKSAWNKEELESFAELLDLINKR